MDKTDGSASEALWWRTACSIASLYFLFSAFVALGQSLAFAVNFMLSCIVCATLACVMGNETHVFESRFLLKALAVLIGSSFMITSLR